MASSDSIQVFERSALRKKSEREVRRSAQRVKLRSPISRFPTRTITVLLTLGWKLGGIWKGRGGTHSKLWEMGTRTSMGALMFGGGCGKSLWLDRDDTDMVEAVAWNEFWG
jgi:hypothetical protein